MKFQKQANEKECCYWTYDSMELLKVTFFEIVMNTWIKQMVICNQREDYHIHNKIKLWYSEYIFFNISPQKRKLTV